MQQTNPRRALVARQPFGEKASMPHGTICNVVMVRVRDTFWCWMIAECLDVDVILRDAGKDVDQLADEDADEDVDQLADDDNDESDYQGPAKENSTTPEPIFFRRSARNKSNPVPDLSLLDGEESEGSGSDYDKDTKKRPRRTFSQSLLSTSNIYCY
jgi:hypothetical protein